jgi:ATP-binding cassette subfamily C protein CydCD
VGYVNDDPHVFATTLGANVRLARPEASDNEVLDALHALGLGSLL